MLFVNPEQYFKVVVANLRRDFKAKYPEGDALRVIGEDGTGTGQFGRPAPVSVLSDTVL
jgi:hypothetical protein